MAVHNLDRYTTGRGDTGGMLTRHALAARVGNALPDLADRRRSGE
jgi:hypothetical protein